jgi:sodium/bile acid cotransporter 7
VLILLVMLKAGATARMHLGGDNNLSVVHLLIVGALCLVIHLAALASGLWSSKVLGFDRPNQIAVAISGSQKTLPVSMLLFNIYYVKQYPLAVFPLVFYHVGQLILDTFIANRLRERLPPTNVG